MENKDKPKALRCVWWFREWQADQASAWLEDKALEGLRLVSTGRDFAVFERCEPQALQYSCIPKRLFRSEAWEVPARQIFLNAGWTSVLARNGLMIQYAPEGTKRPTIPSDDPREKQRLKLKHIAMRAAYSVLLLLFLALLFWAGMQAKLSSDLLLHRNVNMLVSVAAVLAGMVLLVRDAFWLMFRKHRGCVDGPGKAGVLRASCRRTIALKRTLFLLAASVFCLLISKNLFYWPSHRYPSAKERASLMLYSDVTPGFDDSWIRLYFSQFHSFLYPVQETVHEEPYNPSDSKIGMIHSEYYRALSAPLASLLARRFAAESCAEGFDVYPASSPGFDELWTRDDPSRGWHCVLVRNGLDVYLFSCYGPFTSQQVLPLLRAKLR